MASSVENVPHSVTCSTTPILHVLYNLTQIGNLSHDRESTGEDI